MPQIERAIIKLVDDANKNAAKYLFTVEELLEEAMDKEEAMAAMEMEDESDAWEDVPAVLTGRAGGVRTLKEEIDEFEKVLKDFLKTEDVAMGDVDGEDEFGKNGHSSGLGSLPKRYIMDG